MKEIVDARHKAGHDEERSRTPTVVALATDVRDAPRGVPNVQDVDGVLSDPVKNPKWVTNNSGDTNLRALRKARSGLRRAADAVDDLYQSVLDGLGYRGTRIR
jgi:hypothetical protein